MTFGPWPGGAGGAGGVDSIVPGDGIQVDNTDPANPIVAVDLLNGPGISFVVGSPFEIRSSLPANPHEYFPDQLIVPSADWPITAIAPTDQDNTTPAFSIAAFANGTETGRGWSTTRPETSAEGYDVATYTLVIVGKAATAPGAARTVGWKLYYRYFPVGSAVPAWKSIVLADLNVGTNVFGNALFTTLTIGAGAGQLDVGIGSPIYFELTRIVPTAGTNLVGDYNLIQISDYWTWET